MSLRLSEAEYKRLVGDKVPVKKNKYRNNRIKVNGICYDSTKEFQRHEELKILEKCREISNLRFHDKKDKIILQENPKIEYEPDFCYDEKDNHIIEDFKGMQTKEFILKKKMIISKIKKGELQAAFRITKYINGNFVITEEYSI